ncbi:efflux RND transporter permease subunit, partial [bacterium]|nr:efflux RND transporter permease subunit [bacterium]
AVWLGSVGTAISVTILGSLLVSLTVIPALSVFLSKERREVAEPGWIVAMRRRYLRILEWTTFRRPFVTGFAILPGIIALTVGIGAATGFFQQEMDGEQGIRQERLRISYRFTAGVDKKTAKSYVERVEEYLETRREDLGLRDVYSFYGVDAAGMSLFFDREELSTEFLTEVRQDLRENLPVQAGVEYRFGGEEGNDSGVETFQVTVSGEDTDLLEELAREVKRRLAAIEGVSDLTTDADRGHPEIQVAIDRERAGRHGVRADNIAQVLALTYRGTRLPRLRTGEKEIDLSVSLLPEDTESIENLATMVVAIENDRPILLGQIADFRFERSPETIVRRNQKTGVTISGSYEGEKFSEGLEEIEASMKELSLPFGYGWNFGSRIRQARAEQDEMGMNILLALVCVFLVMASLFESLVHPGVVMGSIVFAIVGVIQFMMITLTPLNIMAIIGIVILIGVVVNNGIVLVDHINHLRRTGLSMDDSIRQGCADRIRPVLMTAGTTVLGLVPLAVSNAHMADAEYYPMARAIIGGLLSGTLLTLIVLPTYYRIVNRWVENAGRLLRERERFRRERKGAAKAAPEPRPATGA